MNKLLAALVAAVFSAGAFAQASAPVAPAPVRPLPSPLRGRHQAPVDSRGAGFF